MRSDKWDKMKKKKKRKQDDKTEEFDAFEKIAARFTKNPLEFKRQFTPRPEPSLPRTEKWDKIEKLWDEYTKLVKQEGKDDEIIRCMDSIIQLKPKNVHAWVSKGTALGMLGKQEEALKCCDKAIKMDPPDSLLKLIKGTIERIRQSMDEREISDK